MERRSPTVKPLRGHTFVEKKPGGTPSDIVVPFRWGCRKKLILDAAGGGDRPRETHVQKEQNG